MADDDQQQQLQFPRLAISDLLVLTLTVGFALACIAPRLQDFLKLPDDQGHITTWQAVVTEVTDSLAIGISLFGLIVLARQRIRGSSCPFAPGHWLFIATGPYAALLLVVGPVGEVMAAYVFNDHRRFHAVIDALSVIVLASSIVCSLPGVRALEPRWRVCLSLILAWLALFAAWFVSDAAIELRLWHAYYWRQHLLALSASVYLMAFLAAGTAVAVDTWKGVSRDWLHYFGITTLGLNAVSDVLHYGDLLAEWWLDLFLWLWALFLHLLP